MINLLSHHFLFSFSLYCFSAYSTADIKNIRTDESSLVAFKALVISDPYSMLANNWSTSSSVCNWVGVSCDKKHNRVHSLNLASMGLRGTLSPSLGNLSFLVILDLSNNSFSGQFPKEICWLRRLRILNLNKNKLNEGIPTALGELSQLKYLDIGFNNFSGFIPHSIYNLSKLEDFICEQNSIEGTIPPMIRQLYRLKFWISSNNKMSGLIPKEISNVSSLKGMYLPSNYFSGTFLMLLSL